MAASVILVTNLAGDLILLQNSHAAAQNGRSLFRPCKASTIVRIADWRSGYVGRYFLFGICLAVLLAGNGAAGAQTQWREVENSFQSPPDDARAMMRWWWFGPAVTQPELKREMGQMKAAGFGGFEIQPVYPLELDDPQTGFHNAPFLSPEFLDDVRFANREAHRLGLRVSLTLGSGWPYGGPHTPVTEAADALRLVRATVPPSAQSVPVPELAHGESLISAFLASPNWDSSSESPAPVRLTLPPAGSPRMSLPSGPIATGSTVLWFLSSPTGQQVKRAAAGAEGFVLDHFSRAAVDDHLRNVADKLMIAFADRPPDSIFSDSLEVYGADWTPNLPEEFLKRRGYDLVARLPDLVSENPGQNALDVRHDWGQTLTELIDENYLKEIDVWAEAHHTRFRSQTYGDPAVTLSSNALVALPEGEGPQWRQFSYTRWATSASHLYGRPITSAETWTWLHSPTFRATPLDMKAEADRFFLQGVNQIVGHGWPYSPPEAGEPGWRFYAAGALNAHNPWWPVMPDIARYLQRVSWILRQGKPVNDIAVYLPEDDAFAAFTPGKVSVSDLMPRWITPELTQAIEQSGYGFDYIDAAAIAAKGIAYPVLILPAVERMPAGTVKLILDYAAHGGKVIAFKRLPGTAGGLAEFVKLIPDAAALGRALVSSLSPDLRLTTPAPELGFVHRQLPGADIYFVANTGNLPVKTLAHFRAARNGAEWLDADSGAARPAAIDNGQIELALAPYESRILLFHDGSGDKLSKAAQPSRPMADLSADWQVRFDASGLEETMPGLASWTENLATRYYSGVATYRNSVDLRTEDLAAQRIFLDFGEGTPISEPAGNPGHPGMRALLDPPIREAAEIWINGQRAGSLWHPPYAIEITALLKSGSNEIEIRVANTAINLLSGSDLPNYRLLWARYGQRFTPQDMENLQPLPSGLLGPVKLTAQAK